jgi:hypothetical protein
LITLFLSHEIGFCGWEVEPLIILHEWWVPTLMVANHADDLRKWRWMWTLAQKITISRGSKCYNGSHESHKATP